MVHISTSTQIYLAIKHTCSVPFGLWKRFIALLKIEWNFAICVHKSVPICTLCNKFVSFLQHWTHFHCILEKFSMQLQLTFIAIASIFCGKYKATFEFIIDIWGGWNQPNKFSYWVDVFCCQWHGFIHLFFLLLPISKQNSCTPFKRNKRKKTHRYCCVSDYFPTFLGFAFRSTK